MEEGHGRMPGRTSPPRVEEAVLRRHVRLLETGDDRKREEGETAGDKKGSVLSAKRREANTESGGKATDRKGGHL